MQFYNTLTRSLETFKPMSADGKVRLYTCGPTVYDYAHIGNFRAYMFEDLLRRALKFNGYEVEQVMNLTDVDDKTIRSALEAGLPLKEYTKPYIDAFFNDLDTLNIERAEHYPAATDHIEAMIQLVQTLMDKGVAYKADDGSVYFSIDKFESYGCLAHLDREGMRSGVRINSDEYDKENVADFALWKAWDEDDGDVAWEAPWGRGRPGWHIECSAMSMQYLGESFDIHTGGIDNMFPHHEDEIAQSECATGKQFVKYWLHCAHLIVDGKKMSKSMGNFFTLRQLLEKGYSGRLLRYELLSAHYRQTLNFSFKGLDAARAALGRVDECIERLQKLAADDAGSQAEWLRDFDAAFREGLADDLNVSKTLAALFDMIRELNRRADQKKLPAEEAAGALQLLESWDTVLGVLFSKEEAAVDDQVQALLDERAQARKNRDFETADRIRDQLRELGWAVKDTPDGQEVKPC